MDQKKNKKKLGTERFLKHPKIDVKGTHYELLPFGADRRKCPGTLLGNLFVQVSIARLAHSFNFVLPLGQDPTTLDVEETYAGTMPWANPSSSLLNLACPSTLLIGMDILIIKGATVTNSTRIVGTRTGSSCI